MPTLKRTVTCVAVYGVFGAACAGAVASGCGGDDTTVTVDSGMPDTGGGQPDATMQDASQPDTSHADMSAPDVGDTSVPVPDAPADRSQTTDAPNDVRQDVGRDVVADTAVTDANDAGVDSGDSGPADASDAATCTTTVQELEGDGGVGGDSGPDGALSPMLLFGFDNGVALDTRWTDYGPSTLTFGLTSTDGHACPGALAMTATYTSYGVNAGLQFNYGNPGQDWTGRQRLHFWVKLVTSDYTAFNGVQEVLESANFVDFRYAGYLAASAYSGGNWIESVVDLTPADAGGSPYDPTNVNYFQVQLIALTTAPDGGATASDGSPAAPPMATLLVDDIWLE